MYQWGDPYPENAWLSLKVGDRVRVKGMHPLAGKVGTLKEISDIGDYTVDFGDITMAFDGDMLVKMEKK